MYVAIENLRAAKLGKSPELPRGEWIPGKGDQASFEKYVFDTVSAGGMQPQYADKLLRRCAEAKASGVVYVPGMTTRIRPMSEEEAAREARLARQRRLIAARIPDTYWDVQIEKNPFLTENGKPFVHWQDARYNNVAGFRHCRQIAARWESGTKGVTLFSQGKGVGKSLLAIAAAVYVHDHRLNKDGKKAAICYAKAAQILDLFRDSYGVTWEKAPDKMSTAQVEQTFVVRPDLLVVDELGGEYIKPGEAGEWARVRLLELFDYRFDNHLTTLVTTNLSKGEIESRYGQRLASRLLGRSPMVEMSSPDYRQDDEASDDDSDPFADGGAL